MIMQVSCCRYAWALMGKLAKPNSQQQQCKINALIKLRLRRLSNALRQVPTPYWYWIPIPYQDKYKKSFIIELQVYLQDIVRQQLGIMEWYLPNYGKADIQTFDLLLRYQTSVLSRISYQSKLMSCIWELNSFGVVAGNEGL